MQPHLLLSHACASRSRPAVGAASSELLDDGGVHDPKIGRTDDGWSHSPLHPPLVINGFSALEPITYNVYTYSDN